jgi:hypothetical protein
MALAEAIPGLLLGALIDSIQISFNRIAGVMPRPVNERSKADCETAW